MITVNGAVVKSADMKVDPENDTITLNGSEISYKKHIYIMMNKPQGVVCSTRDGLSPTVLSLVPEDLMRDGLFPAGRLDKDTEGFVLITDDGELAHRMLSPKHHVPKMYYVQLEKDVEDYYSESFSSGITLRTGEECLPAEFYNGKNPRECYVVLHEGMFHQIKRMFEVLDNKVIYLKRLQIGGVVLDEDIPLGGCKEIMHKNVENLLADFDFAERFC